MVKMNGLPHELLWSASRGNAPRSSPHPLDSLRTR